MSECGVTALSNPRSARRVILEIPNLFSCSCLPFQWEQTRCGFSTALPSHSAPPIFCVFQRDSSYSGLSALELPSAGWGWAQRNSSAAQAFRWIRDKWTSEFLSTGSFVPKYRFLNKTGFWIFLRGFCSSLSRFGWKSWIARELECFSKWSDFFKMNRRIIGTKYCLKMFISLWVSKWG